MESRTLRRLIQFGIGVGGYQGVVRVPRRVFQILLPEAPTPERCVECFHLDRTRLEFIAERKVRRRLDRRWQRRDHWSRFAGASSPTNSTPDWLSPDGFVRAAHEWRLRWPPRRCGDRPQREATPPRLASLPRFRHGMARLMPG